MKFLIKFLLGLMLLTSISACQSMKKTLSLQKEKSVDEFLIEKKNPLVVPPEFSKLPKPKNEVDLNKTEEENIDLSKVLGKNKKNKETKMSNDLEKSISNILNKK
tara:strand:+ start:685 stop:999 length:315 start_codon:yes stop_codon:yes gene_type:complete